MKGKIDEKIIQLLEKTTDNDKAKILAILQWENNKRITKVK